MSEPRVRAEARVPPRCTRVARCIPALPLPIYSGSGFAESIRRLGAACSCLPRRPVARPQADVVGRASHDGRVEPLPIPPARDLIETGSSRRSFRVCTCARHHPSARTRPPNCLAGRTPRNTEPTARHPAESRRRLVLLGALSSDCGLSITGGHQPAPDTTPAATLLARLVWSFFTGVTSGGFLRVPTRPGMPRLPPRTRFAVHWTDFRGENTEAPPYPPWPNHSRFGTVSPATGWQGLDAPFIVELFTFRVFDGYPEVVALRRVGVATPRLPTPACVTRTSRALHPNGSANAELWSMGPAGGLGWQEPIRTRLGPDNSTGLHGGAFPARPHSRTSTAMR